MGGAETGNGMQGVGDGAGSATRTVARQGRGAPWRALAGLTVSAAVLSAVAVGLVRHESPPGPGSPGKVARQGQQAGTAAREDGERLKDGMERMADRLRDGTLPLPPAMPSPALTSDPLPKEAAPPPPAQAPASMDAIPPAGREGELPGARPDAAVPAAAANAGANVAVVKEPVAEVVATGDDVPLDCLPARLKANLDEVARRFGRVEVVSTTALHTGNHGRGRAKMHADCMAADIRTPAAPSDVMAFLRTRAGVAGLESFRNGIVHVDDLAAHPPGTTYNGRPPEGGTTQAPADSSR